MAAGTGAVGIGLQPGAGVALAQSTGDRSVTGPLTNSGTLTPGTATTPGVLTVNGNFLQTATGTLAIRLGDAGAASDQLNVRGQATLNGVLSISASRNVETGKSFWILQSTSGLTGAFTKIATPDLGLFRSFTFQNDGTNGYFIVNRLSFSTGGVTNNQKSTGSGLDLTVGSTTTTAAFAAAREAIGYQSAAAASAQLGRISGEGYASAVLGGQVSARAFGEALLRAADDGRGELKKRRKGGFSLWAQGISASDQIADKTAGAASAKANATGGAMGFDYSFGRSLRLGMGGGYTTGDTNVAIQSTAIRTTGAHVGFFAQLDTDIEAALAIGMGFLDNKLSRVTDSGARAQGSAKGTSFSARLSVTVPYRLASGLRLAPYVLASYDSVSRKQFKETTTDIFALNVAKRSTGMTEAQLGAKMGYTYVSYVSNFLSDETRLVPELRLAFSYLAAPKPLSTQESFVNAPDGLFTVAGGKRDQYAGLVGFSVTVKLSSGLSGYIDYSSRINTQTTSTILGGVRYVF